MRASTALSLLGVAFLSAGVALVASSVQAEDVPSIGALGPVPVPADNPMSDEKVELGKLLFFDARLSGDASTSCASCHKAESGFQDGADICRGYPGTVHWRNCQTVVNTGYYNKLFWAGGSTSLEAQAPTAAKGAVAGNGKPDIMQERLRQIPEYQERFRDVFGREPLIEDAWRAIAAFERSLVQRDTPFDLYMLGDEKAMSADAVAGMKLFEGKAGCVQCHNGPFLTDEKYYNLGVPDNWGFEEDALKQITVRYEQYAKGVSEETYRSTKTDLGLYYQTKQKSDRGKFRTPTLRYLTFTPPYMHNGMFFTLEEVVDFYDAGGGDDAVAAVYGPDATTKTELLEPLGLTDTEKKQLVAFMEALTGDEIRVETPALPPYAVMEVSDASQ